jgi:hypothetical protein
MRLTPARIWQFATVFVISFLASGATRGGQQLQLLYTLPISGGGAASPVDDRRVEVVFQHTPQDDPSRVFELGRGTLWDVGETGTVDYSALTTPGFPGFAEALSDGRDDYILPLIEWPGAGGGGWRLLESDLGFGQPDFIGYDIDFIRLKVEDLAIDPWANGFTAELLGVYEFWGSPVPEPGSLALLAFGSIAALRAAARWQRSRAARADV